jgi:sporulation protein YunB
LFLVKSHSFLKILLFILLIIITLILIIKNTISPIFFNIAEAEAVRIANQAINEAVGEESNTINYEDLIMYKQNNEGNIVLMQPNIRKINQFSSNVSLKIQRKLEELRYKEVLIPMGKLLGLDILAGLGPYLKTRIIPYGFVQPPILMDSFHSAGINQTRHKIYIQVGVKLKLIIPFSRDIIELKAVIPITEVTILGNVPEVYVGFNEEGVSGILNNN